MRFFTFLLLSLTFIQSTYAKEWAFNVYLDKSKIGEHTFNLDGQTLKSKASFKVKVLFINAYQYEHQAIETWQNDCLQALQSNTIENKITYKIDGELKDAEFIVDDGKTKQKLPECTMTFAYWNQKILSQSHLLNPQNAEWLDAKITKLESEIITVKGKKVKTSHYSLVGSLEGKNKLLIELWYDEQQNWVALKSITPEGYTISYQLK